MFSRDFSRFFIFTQASHKLGMPEPVGFGPFEELNLRNEFRSQPDRFFHRLGIKFTAEAGGMRLG